MGLNWKISLQTTIKSKRKTQSALNKDHTCMFNTLARCQLRSSKRSTKISLSFHALLSLLPHFTWLFSTSLRETARWTNSIGIFKPSLQAITLSNMKSLMKLTTGSSTMCTTQVHMKREVSPLLVAWRTTWKLNSRSCSLKNLEKLRIQVLTPQTLRFQKLKLPISFLLSTMLSLSNYWRLEVTILCSKDLMPWEQLNKESQPSRTRNSET